MEEALPRDIGSFQRLFNHPSGVVINSCHGVKGEEYDTVIGQPDIKRICTLALCRSLLPGLDRYNQSAMLYLFARDRARMLMKEAHSATQSVQPWQFGHPETKRTFFWLKNLPQLRPTDIVERLRCTSSSPAPGSR